jgi:hypothetical protein
MQKLDEAAYGDIAKQLGDQVAAYAPEWTNTQESEPTAELMELFAFLTESLLDRANAITERTRYSADRLAELARALANRSQDAASCGLERPHFFSGQALGVEDFRLEQEYFRLRLRRLNRELHGSGIVRGLEVSVQSDGSNAGWRVAVTPGFALTPQGEEIEVCAEQTIDLPKDGHVLYVTLLLAESPSHPEPTADGGTQFARIDERCAIRVEAAIVDNGATLARLLRDDQSWRLDSDFTPVRAK